MIRMFIYCFTAITPLINSCYHTSRNFNDVKDFHDWRIRYNKSYPSESHVQRSLNHWLSNRDFIEQHNDMHHDYKLELNAFSDVDRDFNMVRKNYNMHLSSRVYEVPSFVSDDPNLPDSVDWRKHDRVSSVKNQGQCGSCWAFSAAASMEGQHARASGQLLNLSESQIVDCDGIDYGCDGGFMDNAFKYAIKNGMETYEAYPYTAMDGKCNYKSSDVVARFSSFKDITGGENGLKKAVAEVGPISVGIDASMPDFQFYRDGVYFNKDCSQTQLDHGVLVVGYGTTSNGTDYWIVKNSWGENWGRKGYIWMARNKNNSCGIATSASYPVV